jgi:hypothetical protein
MAALSAQVSSGSIGPPMNLLKRECPTTELHSILYGSGREKRYVIPAQRKARSSKGLEWTPTARSRAATYSRARAGLSRVRARAKPSRLRRPPGASCCGDQSNSSSLGAGLLALGVACWLREVTREAALWQQFLMAGAGAGEACLYVTFSETSAELLAVARSHGWSLDDIRILELANFAQQLTAEAERTLFDPADIEPNPTMISAADVANSRF